MDAKLIEYLPSCLVDKIINFPVPMNNIHIKIIWKFSPDSKFQKMIKFLHILKQIIKPLLNHIWKLKTISKIKLFSWKLIRARIHVKHNLRKIGMALNSDCPFCDSHLEDNDHLFR